MFKTECLRHNVNTPFGVIITRATFSNKKGWCEGYVAEQDGVSEWIMQEWNSWRQIWMEEWPWFCKNADRFIAFNPVAYFDYDRNDHKTELEVLDFERRAVKKSDVMLVNLRNIEKSVGTICELAWAFEYDIPIVAFYESEDEYELQLHPWIENMCDRIECGTGAMEKTLRYIRDYYSVF